MSKAKRSSRGLSCSSCHTALQPKAKFCHECGALTDDKPEAKRWSWKSISPAVLIVAASFGLLLVVGNFATEKKIPPDSPQPNMAAPPRQVEKPVDISTMTPRQAADRLFNRVMSAEESGDVAQAKQFAPMALQAYRLVERPDADANFHMGLINLVLDNLDDVRKQIEILKRDSTEHLLGLALALRVAKRVGDDKSASVILTRFAAAYDTEIKRGKSEYGAHRVTIEKLRNSTTGLKTTSISSQNPNDQESGKPIFESKCAGCHGRDAAGSDKGPPLVHRIYVPGHHADSSFYRAVRQGVKSHHWSFGDMMPIPDISEEQIGQIVSYVRKLQVKNGIK